MFICNLNSPGHQERRKGPCFCLDSLNFVQDRKEKIGEREIFSEDIVCKCKIQEGKKEELGTNSYTREEKETQFCEPEFCGIILTGVEVVTLVGVAATATLGFVVRVTALLLFGVIVRNICVG